MTTETDETPRFVTEEPADDSASDPAVTFSAQPSGSGDAFEDRFNFGVYNGAFAKGPPRPADNIDPWDSAGSNFMPNWRFVQSSNTNITAKQVAAASSPSGSNLRFTFVAGSADDEAYVEQIVFIGGSRLRWFGHIGRLVYVGVSASSGTPVPVMYLQYLTASGAPTGAEKFAPGAATVGTVIGLTCHASVVSPPQDAYYLRVRTGVRRGTVPAGGTAVVDFTDVRLSSGGSHLIVGENTTPSTYGAGYISQEVGAMTFAPDGASGNLMTLHPVDGLVVDGNALLNNTVQIGEHLLILENAAPGTPASGRLAVYADTSGVLHSLNDAGTDTALGAGGGAPTTADYLVGTAQGGLSAEIVVGATPGGELGGTWGTPTVDATHSGSAHIVDHTHAATGTGANGGGNALDVNAGSLRVPVGTGALTTTEGYTGWQSTTERVRIYDGQRERSIGDTGWVPYAFPINYSAALAFTTATPQLVAAGGSCAIPIFVPGHMLLQSVLCRNTNGATERTWGWDLYEQRLNNGNAGENTLDRVAASTANETFTPGAASTREIAAATLPTYLAPGLYWLVVQNRHASNVFNMGCTAASAAFVPNINQTKTTTNPNGATLDFVAATWTKDTSIIAVALRGRVFGQTAGY